ncbi:dTDP-4-dehydrorhamnose 3,5-epimerase [Paenibacillus urinalis]|uniref:dTDP-4-dehydrorhamnose 3,5-epimerase n=1 Tax=Paenibacillus urinalis TaxID=521520 RepID=A0ABY7XFB6_9BACL|nr:dTDP-4-dehydrorhamnose 3,5-epimerase [Paenibacillus urinalis]WDH99816.1 dTDP-4-dehydrorhamnose 3,5-epimerase [Paenibacillus urinalis]WDI03446.1 dTDP-4-dehydrorhamnose 3,5-epimerase [Paenibacillus urinalis]
MNIIQTKIPDVLIIETPVFGDNRGFFMESYNKQVFSKAGIEHDFIQDNHSYSAEAGTLRGLHYQLSPAAQTKLVRVLAGAIYDVAVDIRKNSATYGEWVAVILSESNKRQLLIPKGFAHGFCTISPHTQVAYKVDSLYSKENDRGILWSDHELGIDWPSTDVILSDKDQLHPTFKEADNDF